MKKIIKKLLNVLGIQIILNKKKSASKYFNTGKLSPIEENSVVLYDNFYGDVNAVNEYYKGFRIEFYEKVLKNVKESGVELDGKNIIDVGCGVGYLLEKIQRQAKPIKLSGADFSYEAVKASITRFKGIEFFQYDVSNLLEQKYDVIFCTEVIEHIIDPYSAVKNLHNALNDNGILVLTVPNGRRDTINEHINFWSPESWCGFLSHMFPDAVIKTEVINNDLFNFGIIYR